MKLPKGWTLKSMAELGEVQAGRQRNPNFTVGEQRPYLRVANVQDGWIDFSDVKQMPFTKSETTVYELKAGDVLLAEGQSFELVGRPAVYRGEVPGCCFQNTLVRLRPVGHDPDFCYYVCNWLFVRGTFQKIAKQTTSIAHLGVSRFAEVTAVVPPLSEQRKIADILCTWDEALERLDALIAAKERRNAGLVKALLSGRTRLPREKSKWQMRSIGELLVPTNRYETWDDNRTYSLAGVRRNSGGVFFRADISGRDIKVKVCKRIRVGDFLISRRQVSYGGMAIVPREFDGFAVNDEYEVLVPADASTLDVAYLGFVSRTPEFRHLAYRASNGFFAERLRLNFDLGVFLAERIRLPSSVEEQRRISEVLAAADLELRLLREKRRLLDLHKRGLMQRLLTGKVRVRP